MHDSFPFRRPSSHTPRTFYLSCRDDHRRRKDSLHRRTLISRNSPPLPDRSSVVTPVFAHQYKLFIVLASLPQTPPPGVTIPNLSPLSLGTFENLVSPPILVVIITSNSSRTDGTSGVGRESTTRRTWVECGRRGPGARDLVPRYVSFTVSTHSHTPRPRSPSTLREGGENGNGPTSKRGPSRKGERTTRSLI